MCTGNCSPSPHFYPAGIEFVRPVVGYFCNLCQLIYADEDEAKVQHCSSLAHYRKYQVSIQQEVARAVPSADCNKAFCSAGEDRERSVGELNVGPEATNVIQETETHSDWFILKR